MVELHVIPCMSAHPLHEMAMIFRYAVDEDDNGGDAALGVVRHGKLLLEDTLCRLHCGAALFHCVYA